jgi:ABC-2 type transport system ATP-binding protein
MKLIISNITKKYSSGPLVLDDISIQINSGMFGLLGPNGAGKSTLMRTLATLQLPDSGKIYFDDIDILEDPFELRKILGYLPQDFGVYPRVSARDLMIHIAWVKGVNDKKARGNLVDYLLELVNLDNDKNRLLGTFSGGMKQRFGIAQALLGDPKLLIVDEPTAGLDPVERNRFYNILSELSQDKIIILSTHIVDDVKNLCDELAILNKGKIVTNNKPSEIISKLEGKIATIFVSREDQDRVDKNYQILSKVFREGKYQYRIFLNGSENRDEITICEANLEDYYFAVIYGYINA